MRSCRAIWRFGRCTNETSVVAGASGGIGQPLSLLLKISPLISELALYDVVNTPGVAADLSHISSPAVCTREKEHIGMRADERAETHWLSAKGQWC